MAVLFVSDNFSDFTGTFTVLEAAAAARFDFDVAGACLQTSNDATVTSPNFFTNVADEWWFHCILGASENDGSNVGSIVWRNASDAERYRLFHNSSDNSFQFQVFESAAWVNKGGTFTMGNINNVSPTTLDIHVIPGSSSDGTLQIYVDNTITIDQNADITIDPDDGDVVQSFTFSGFTTGVGHTSNISEIVVTDGDPTLEWRVNMLNPDGAGAHAEWTNGAVTDIDEIALDVSDFIDTTTAAQRDSYTMSNLDASIPSTHAVVEVHTFYDLFRSSAAPIANFESFIRTDIGTDSTFTTITQPPADTNTKRRVTYANDPTDGGAAWDQTKVNALQVGVRSAA